MKLVIEHIMLVNNAITIDAMVQPPTHPPYPAVNMINPPVAPAIVAPAVVWALGAHPLAANTFDLDPINFGPAPLPAPLQAQVPAFGMHKFSNM